MGKNFLDQDGQERLKKVLEYAQDDLSRVRDGIVRALRGVDERGRRTYLWNQLQTRSVCTIKARLKKFEQAPPAPRGEVSLWSQRDLNDAFGHQCRISAGITDDD